MTLARAGALALALLLAVPATAAAAEPDRKVGQHLDARKVRYALDEAGDYEVSYELAGGRTQLAFVRSVTFGYGRLSVREIVSIGYRSESDAFPASVANRMLEHNNGAKLGGWGKEGRLGIFISKIPADASADELVDAIEVTVNLADELEREFTPDKDEF